MDLVFMGPRNKVWFLCCGVSHRSPGDVPSRRRGKVSLGLCTLLPGQRVPLPGPDLSFSKKHTQSLQRGGFRAVPVRSSLLAGIRWRMLDVVPWLLPSGDASVHQSLCLGAAVVGCCCVLWTSSCPKTGLETMDLLLIFV